MGTDYEAYPLGSGVAWSVGADDNHKVAVDE